jgi:putative ABC transport system ATP-binding protein
MIEMDNIVKVYSMGNIEVPAIQGVTCHIERGEMAAIIGPSGSGKSTLMNIMGCLDKPTSGQYHLDNINVANMSDDELAGIRNKKIGFVFQSFNLLARTTALANVELPLLYSGISNRHQHSMEALKMVGLSERAQHNPSELSGGEQQRVTIARALVNNPTIILADEPTGALDTKSSAEILKIFSRLNREKSITIIYITHEAEIAAYANHIIHLRDGKIVDEEKK